MTISSSSLVDFQLLQGRLLKVGVRGISVSAKLDLSDPSKTVTKVFNLFEKADVKLTSEERREILNRVNTLLEEELKRREAEDFSISQFSQFLNVYRQGGEQKCDGVTFEGERRKYLIKADDGVIANPAALFVNASEALVVGELFLSHVIVEQEGEDGPFTYETIEPILVYSIHKGPDQIERKWAPLREVEYLSVDGSKPISLEKSTRLKATIKTLLDLQGFQSFLNGNNQIRSLSEIYRDVKERVQKFAKLDWDPRLYDLLSCYAVATYFYDAFYAFPWLYFYGPQGSGKTRGALTVTYLSRHGYAVTRPSDASIYRLCHAIRPTLCIDEGLLGPGAWKLARAAFKKGFQVPRVEKTDREEMILALFDIFMPIVIASTERPIEAGGEEADEARCIFVYMQQQKDPMGRDPIAEDFADLRRELYLFRLLRGPELLKAQQELRSESLSLFGHEKEVWLPIFTIAKMVGDGVFDSIKELAEDLYELKSMDLYKEEKTILRAIEEAFNEGKKSNLEGRPYLEFTPKALSEYIKMVLVEDGEFENEQIFVKIWNVRRIGRLLKRLSIKMRRVGRGRNYYITKAELTDLMQRFGLISDESDESDVNFERGVGEKFNDKNNDKISEDTTPKNNVTNVTNVTRSSDFSTTDEKIDGDVFSEAKNENVTKEEKTSLDDPQESSKGSNVQPRDQPKEKPKYEVHACHEPFKSICSYCFERCMITHYVNGRQACSKCADKALRGEI